MRARFVGSRIETSHINKQRVVSTCRTDTTRTNMSVRRVGNVRTKEHKVVCCVMYPKHDFPQRPTAQSTHFPLARAHKVFLLAFAQWLRADSLFPSREPVDDDYVIVVQSEHALPNTQPEKHRASTSAYNLCTHETKSNPSGVWDIYATNVRKELIHNTL